MDLHFDAVLPHGDPLKDGEQKLSEHRRARLFEALGQSCRSPIGLEPVLGRGRSQVEDMVETLNKIEDETDQMGIQLTRSLFAQEDSM